MAKTYQLSMPFVRDPMNQKMRPGPAIVLLTGRDWI
jgi:hypothetical protein